MADKKEFENTAMPHLDAVYRAAVVLCGRRDQAEDLAQVTYLKALKRFNSLTPGTNCRAWLLRILRNTWIDELRHRRIVGPQLPVEEGLLADTSHQEKTVWSNAIDILESFSNENVIKAMKQLSDEQRLTLFLVDVEQLTQVRQLRFFEKKL